MTLKEKKNYLLLKAYCNAITNHYCTNYHKYYRINNNS